MTITLSVNQNNPIYAKLKVFDQKPETPEIEVEQASPELLGTINQTDETTKKDLTKQLAGKKGKTQEFDNFYSQATAETSDGGKTISYNEYSRFICTTTPIPDSNKPAETTEILTPDLAPPKDTPEDYLAKTMGFKDSKDEGFVKAYAEIGYDGKIDRKEVNKYREQNGLPPITEEAWEYLYGDQGKTSAEEVIPANKLGIFQDTWSMFQTQVRYASQTVETVANDWFSSTKFIVADDVTLALLMSDDDLATITDIDPKDIYAEYRNPLYKAYTEFAPKSTDGKPKPLKWHGKKKDVDTDPTLKPLLDKKDNGVIVADPKDKDAYVWDKSITSEEGLRTKLKDLGLAQADIDRIAEYWRNSQLTEEEKVKVKKQLALYIYQQGDASAQKPGEPRNKVMEDIMDRIKDGNQWVRHRYQEEMSRYIKDTSSGQSVKNSFNTDYALKGWPGKPLFPTMPYRMLHKHPESEIEALTDGVLKRGRVLTGLKSCYPEYWKDDNYLKNADGTTAKVKVKKDDGSETEVECLNESTLAELGEKISAEIETKMAAIPSLNKKDLQNWYESDAQVRQELDAIIEEYATTGVWKPEWDQKIIGLSQGQVGTPEPAK